MANRVELKDSDLENVAGGAWNYYDSDGNGTFDKVKIDGVGTYNCNDSTKSKVIGLILNNPSLSASEIADLALSKGYIW